MYMYVRQAYFNKKLMLMSRMIDDNLVSLSKIDSVTITVENHHLVTVCTPNAYGSKVVCTVNAQDTKCGLYVTKD